MQIRNFSSLLLASALTVSMLPGIALAQDGAKQDMRDAGHETKNAAKDTGHGIDTGTRKAYHKTKRGTKKAYHKTARGTKKATHATENFGDRVADKPQTH